nr:uncharacterized protein LOC113807761 [Penaeus vannamei]
MEKRGLPRRIRDDEDDEDDEDDLKKGLRMDDDDLLSLALHMSAQEAENKEYRRQVAALLAREPAGAGDVPGAEGGWQEEAEGRPGKEEAYCHEELEGLDGKKLRLEKEEAEGEENMLLVGGGRRTATGHGYVTISPDKRVRGSRLL